MANHSPHTKAQKRKRATASHCAYCERPFKDKKPYARTIDHFYPLDADRKHLNQAWNKFIVCHRCNLIKANKSPLQFIKYATQKICNPAHPRNYLIELGNIIDNVTRYHKELEGYFIMRDLI